MKILSFDIGTHSVKALELESLFGRLELKDYFLETVIEEGLPTVTTTNGSTEEAAATSMPVRTRHLLSVGQLAAVERILTSRTFKYDKLVICLPKSLVTTRLLNFPTKDKKAIAKSIAFELEDDLPIDLADVTYDFSILQPQGTGSTVYAVVALKRDLVSVITQLQNVGLDPDVITTEGWATSQLMTRALHEDLVSAPVCVINLGAKQTVFHMIVAGRPILSHTVSVGGSNITQSIASSYGLTFEQAERAKIDGGFLLTEEHFKSDDASSEITEEQKRFAQAIGDAMIPIVREIRQTLMSFKSQYHMSPKAIFVTGGSSLVPNFGLYLEEILDTPVMQLSFSSRVIGESLQLSENTEALFSSAMGLALSSIKLERFASINLRKDEFSKHTGMSAFSIKAFSRPLKYVAASLAFIYANLMIQYFVLSSRATTQDDRLERAVKSVLGAVSRSSLSTYTASPSTLKNAVNKEIAKYKTTEAEPEKKRISALDVLHNVSKIIPKDVVVDVSQFVVKDGRFELKGQLNQTADHERLAKLLDESKLMTELNKGTPQEDSKTKRIKFEYSAKLAESPNAATTR